MVVYKEYDKQTLDRLHEVELSILRDFKKITEENGLSFFISGGTAIGALRHGGFIPWDDDIDVCLPRGDYDRLIEILEADPVMMEKYEIIRADRTENYPLMSTRLRKRGTKFKEWPFKKVKCDLGIFLDIFPYDHTVEDPVLRRKQIRQAWFWSKMYILRHIANPVLPFKGVKGAFVTAFCACVHAFLVVTRFSKPYMLKKYQEAATRYNDEETGWYIDFQYTFPEKMLLRKEDIFPLRKVMFEDVEVTTLHEIDRYLTGQYGDYMQMPPPEKRKNHYPYELDFGDGNE